MKFTDYKKNNPKCLVKLIVLIFILYIPQSFAYEFPYKNWVWASPDCTNPTGLTTWVDFGGNTLIRYDYETVLGFSKNVVQTIDAGGNYGSNQYNFKYYKENISDIYLMTQESAQAQWRSTNGKVAEGNFNKMTACDPNSVGAKKIFGMINTPSIEKNAPTYQESYRRWVANEAAKRKKLMGGATEVSVIDLQVYQKQYKGKLVMVNCVLSSADGYAVTCTSPENDSQSIHMHSETMNKEHLRWAINNCSRYYWNENSYSCRNLQIIGLFGTKSDSYLENARIFTE
jgi:hypothetical protein